MNKQDACKLAGQFAERWPGLIQTGVETPPRREHASVLLTIPREHRRLRITHQAQVRGVLAVCTLLLGKPERKKKNMQDTAEKKTQESAEVPLYRAHDQDNGDRPKRAYRRSTQALPEPAQATSPEQEVTGEVHLLQALIAHAFQIPGVLGLGRLTEVPRTWKVDVVTTRGPESYRVTRNVDGSFQQERWS